MNQNIFPRSGLVSHGQRCKILGQIPGVYWFTGLSGAGKTTLSQQVESRLVAMGKACYLLDGDIMRSGMCKDLGFSTQDRTENLRRVAEVAKILLDSGIICLAAFISPLKTDREMVRQIIGVENYHEIFVYCPLEVCEQRDPKGLYRLARQGIIKDFTGISAAYDEPDNPGLRVDSTSLSVGEASDRIIEFIQG